MLDCIDRPEAIDTHNLQETISSKTDVIANVNHVGSPAVDYPSHGLPAFSETWLRPSDSCTIINIKTILLAAMYLKTQGFHLLCNSLTSPKACKIKHYSPFFDTDQKALQFPLHFPSHVTHSKKGYTRMTAKEFNLEAYLEALKPLVNIDCGTNTPAGVARIADMMTEKYENIGWQVTREDFGEQVGPGLLVTNKPGAEQF